MERNQGVYLGYKTMEMWPQGSSTANTSGEEVLMSTDIETMKVILNKRGLIVHSQVKVMNAFLVCAESIVMYSRCRK